MATSVLHAHAHKVRLGNKVSRASAVHLMFAIYIELLTILIYAYHAGLIPTIKPRYNRIR